jgi:tellurite resistance protein TehA-like permease
MASSNNYNLGKNVIIAGLIIQIVVFGIFVLVAALFHVRMRKCPTPKALSPGIPWQKHLWVLYIASALILVRSLFRLVEYIQGNDGYLLSREWYLYVFDGCLMVAVMGVFAWWHPSEVYALLKGGKTRAIKKGLWVVRLENQWEGLEEGQELGGGEEGKMRGTLRDERRVSS